MLLELAGAPERSLHGSVALRQEERFDGDEVDAESRPLILAAASWHPDGAGLVVSSDGFVTSFFDPNRPGVVPGTSYGRDQILGCGQPMWGPGGSLGACAVHRPEGTRISVFGVDAEFRSELTNSSDLDMRQTFDPDGLDLEPAFSADGGWIVWWNVSDDGPFVYVGSVNEGWHTGPTLPGHSPQPAPVGLNILMVRPMGLPANGSQGVWIYVIDILERLNGLEGQVGITTAGGGVDVWAHWPVWSPDGTRVVFVSTVDSEFGEIYVADADGGNVERITFNDSTEMMLAWAP